MFMRAELTMARFFYATLPPDLPPLAAAAMFTLIRAAFHAADRFATFFTLMAADHRQTDVAASRR